MEYSKLYAKIYKKMRRTNHGKDIYPFEIGKKGIASHIAESIGKKGFQILDDREITRFAEENPEFGELLQKYFEKSM